MLLYDHYKHKVSLAAVITFLVQNSSFGMMPTVTQGDKFDSFGSKAIFKTSESLVDVHT